MKKLLLPLVTAIATSCAMADVWVNPGFYSYHFQRDQGFNNVNTGLGFEASLSDTYSLTGGFFKNSDRDTSRYLGVYAMPFKAGAFKAGAALGAFDGYPKMRDGGWFPAVVPTVAFEGQKFGLNVSFIPTIGDKLHGAITFGFKYKIAP